ncbi:ATPase component of ABC transporters with duplicated ATPase domains [Bacteroidales bacterium 6E]|nr:ATPase component of ABC transporters with duplicated ATPase domains [Bacteroidales bacterium 6E]
MVPYLQVEEVSKRYGDRLLFENISFTINKDDKVALIAPNGAGKTSLLDLIAGKESPDSGKITRTNDITFGYFEQIPTLDPSKTVMNEIFSGDNERIQIIREFEDAVLHHRQEDIARLSGRIDQLGAWDVEVEIRQILTQLKINNLDAIVGELSGGQKKRLALAKVLIGQPDFLILDEPTNHLDLDMIEWLEKYLDKSRITVLMVTHDRYFLDRICNEIIELEDNVIYKYRGNYSYYLEKRDERIQSQQASVAKAQNLMRTEIEWIRRMPKARGTKAKYRVDAFDQLQEQARQKSNEKSVRLDMKSSRLGKKILEIKGVSKSYGPLNLVTNFSYSFSRFEKVGIIGDNGSGKSTFLNLITGLVTPDTGEIETGQTIKFGYYRQDGIQFDMKEKVIDAVTKIAEDVQLEGGIRLSATQLLTKFLFPPSVQYDFVEKLSGGEKRRLYLCTILMQNPNFLILDEPTNDLDIMTLNVLEDYLADFDGCVIIVSHDRFFMDKIADHLFVFDGKGSIADFPGNYTQYRNKIEEEAAERKTDTVKTTVEPSRPKNTDNTKLTYKEKRELEQLEVDIPLLEERKKELEELLNSGTLDHNTLFSKSQEIVLLSEKLEEMELRWLELSDKG